MMRAVRLGVESGRWCLRLALALAFAAAPQWIHAQTQELPAQAAEHLAQLTAAAPATNAPPANPELIELLNRSAAAGARQDSKSAYRILLEQEARYAGDPTFDFQLGLAALAAADPARAIFAFERVVALQPDNLRARAELAQAYAQNRELDAARLQLEQVAKQQLPAAVRLTIERFLNAIDLQRSADSGSANQWSAAVEISLGHDTNANVGSSNSTWIGAGGLTLYPSRQLLGQSSNFLNTTLHLTHSRRLDDRWSWSNGASVGQLWNSTGSGSTIASNFGTVDARSGLAYRADAQEWSLTMLAQHLRQDNDASRNAIGLNAQWQVALKGSRLASYLQTFRFSHPSAPQRDTVRTVGGLSFVTTPTGSDSSSTVVVASASAGRESAKDLAQFGFRLLQARLSAERVVNQTVRLFASIGAERRNYDAVDPLFGSQVRHDTEKDVKFGVQWDMGRGWSLAPTVSIAQNSSSVSAYEYTRRQYFLFARYRF